MKAGIPWKRKEKIKRLTAAGLAAVLFFSSTVWTVPVRGSDIWPQKATAPFYCLDGGKGWQKVDRYDNYKFDTLPSPLSETQARRLFWAYPSIWNQTLKDAARKYDPELYKQISSTLSDANVVKRVKDDSTTKFAWVADNPEIEERAIDAILKGVTDGSSPGKEAPDAIREATSEEKAVPFTVLPFSDGPNALDTEFLLGSDFVRDIARIEPQSVWDNGSTGGNVGWLDASQDKNIAKSVLGENLYEVTWGGDSIKIHNNGSALANENAVGSEMPDEVKYNKTVVRYKITLREGSGWYTETEWNNDYLHEWMNYKACVNSPEHQRLYQAFVAVKASAPTFYLVINQGSSDTPSPDYGIPEASIDFQVYRHEETFESDYKVRLKKMDYETGKPLKGSQFYLYERFDGEGDLSDSQKDAGLVEEKLSFTPWKGFQIFSEGTTDGDGIISYTDSRSYEYSKTYCSGHSAPSWAEIPEEEADELTGEVKNASEIEATKDKNRAIAQTWLDLVTSCEEEAENSDTHFHWLAEEDLVESMGQVLENGEPSGSGGEADKEEAFKKSGCKADCEETYETFINLKFTYTWKEIQAKTGYILHGLHSEDVPIEMVTTNSSQAGAESSFANGYSRDIQENIWYAGNGGRQVLKDRVRTDEKAALYSGEPARGPGLEETVLSGLSEGSRLADSVRSFAGDIVKLKFGAVASGSNSTAASDIVGRGSIATASDASEHADVADFADAMRHQGTADSADASLSIGTATSSNAARGLFLQKLFPPGQVLDSADDGDWEDGGSGGDFQSYLDSAETDGIDHLDRGDDFRYSHCNGKDDCGDFWQVYDHRTEGRIHMNKRDLDLFKKEQEGYSSYGDTEGDGTLEGAVYGLFAAEDILHPDSDVNSDGTVKNTGIVYRRNDLAAVSTTDKNGNADFLVFTERPGRTYDYEKGKIGKREDLDWEGPENLYQNNGFKAEIDDYTGDSGTVRMYQNNEEQNGNSWIGRPLLLGKYYVKELSRSEGFELSVNGITQEKTNQGAGMETPEGIALAHGTAVLSMPELSAAMEGEDGSGNGYNQLPFYVTSSGTVDPSLGTDGYDLVLSGFPEGTEFYRVDSSEQEVTGPHVTGTEETPVRDENGNPVWKRAESDFSHIKYKPVYGGNGELTGQEPVSREEAQILKADQIPHKEGMQITVVDFDSENAFFLEPIGNYDLSDETDTGYLFIKANVEETLKKNGYDVPMTADGSCSTTTHPVYSRGVRKGQPDLYGQTTTVGEPAVKTVYGAAIAKLEFQNPAAHATMMETITAVLSWYRDHPEWSFGGIDQVEKTAEGYTVTLYAGAANRSSRRYFTMKESGGKMVVDKVYAVLENPYDLRWVYQEYAENGDYTFEINRQYASGSGSARRYYMDAVLKPAMLVNQEGKLQEILHTVMVYHQKGEEIIDYITGDAAHGFRVPLTETKEKIEITTEMERVEQDVPLAADYDKTAGTYTVHVKASGIDHYGTAFTDENGSLKLSFLAVTKQKKTVLMDRDIESLGAANVFGYQAGDEIGYVQYLMQFGNGSVGVSVSAGTAGEDTYIVTKRLSYRGQDKIQEDGGTGDVPLQVLERPIKQKVKVVKDIGEDPDGRKAIPNFRFRIYLKSNLERLYRNESGTVFWQDKNGNPVEIDTYRKNYPELVQKIYTEGRDGHFRVLETVSAVAEDGTGKTRVIDQYNYEKFFDAVRTADADKWKNTKGVLNSSFKPFAASSLTGIPNEINTSAEAKENAKRSDAVRQFAITWYLDEEADRLLKEDEDGELQGEGGAVPYSDRIYDKALYAAILKAEKYLKPFFAYNFNRIYSIEWDSEEDGGIDRDRTTLAADSIFSEDGEAKYYYGVSKYLSYGDYVLVEQQPYNPVWKDLANRHFAVDKPRELSLPEVYEDGLPGAQKTPEEESKYYNYNVSDTPDDLARKYLIRFNEEMAGNHTDDIRSYVIRGHSHDGDFEVYKYGLDRDQTAGHYEPYGNQTVAQYYHYDSASENAGVEDQVQFYGTAADGDNPAGMYWKDGVAVMTGVRTAYDGKYAPMLVPWTVAEPETEEKDCTQNADGTSSYKGYAYRKLHNIFYKVKLRIEKLDAETGEQILHEGAVFALYAAERNDGAYGDGTVRRYEKDTVITGSKQFLEAMKAQNITPLARGREVLSSISWDSKGAPGETWYGTVPAGTPICKEKDGIIFERSTGCQIGRFEALSTVRDGEMKGEEGGRAKALQTTGYLETDQPVGAGAYVLAELKTPSGYVRSGPVPVEVYSDRVSYYFGTRGGGEAPDGGETPDGGEMPNAGTGSTTATVFAYSENEKTARIFVNDMAVRLEVSKIKTSDSSRKMKISGRVEGSMTELSGKYGLENLELAYNSSGKYLGYGWFKGTLEYLENRRDSGENIEIVYGKDHVFSGFGYVTRPLDSAEDENRYVAGAKLALYDAIEVHPAGDTQDYGMEGLTVERDQNGNVRSILVKKGYAGERTEFTRDQEGVWSARTVRREDTPVLFYDLGGLSVIRKKKDGTLTGYGRHGEKQQITSETHSVFAVRSGIPVFELVGESFEGLVYEKGARAFTALPPGMEIYHLDGEGNRDAMVDGYTGLAYVEHSGSRYVWPVVITKDDHGNVISREKILTGRPAEVHADTKDAYVTGTVLTDRFAKYMNPVYDIHGLVQYYLKSGELYKKGEPIYDRDGDYVRYRYEDLLNAYNRAAYQIKDQDSLEEVGEPENESDDEKLWRRSGEADLIPNIWISGEHSPNDPRENTMTWGQADMLKRVYPGTYIMEELEAPEGYVRSMPEAVAVGETEEIQKAVMSDERTKIEIVKIDAAKTYRVPVVDCSAAGGSARLKEFQAKAFNTADSNAEEFYVEGKGAYSYDLIKGVELALYKAERVYTSDFETYPKGYYLKKAELTPAVWTVESPVDNHPVEVTARWITDGKAIYFEGIPSGDYILEELDAPPGYGKRSIELTVEETEKLQSFVLKNDHTKLEIYKYEEDRHGEKKPLANPYRAKLALYPAKTDENGTVMMENGIALYDPEKPVDSWWTDDLSDYISSLTTQYERTFAEYGDAFSEFSWEVERKNNVADDAADDAADDVESEPAGNITERYAKLLESHGTDGQENVTQIWELDDGSRFRVTACRNSGNAQIGEDGYPEILYEYQFNYKERGIESKAESGKEISWKGENDNKKFGNVVSYDNQAGRHRIDRLPEGFYVLVEEQAPDGYGKAKPELIAVADTASLQRCSMKNESREFYVDKTDESGRQIKGAELALYRPDENGGFVETADYLIDSWITGTEGRYTADDRADGSIPAGYDPGDFRIHRLPALEAGEYFLAEKTAPEFYIPIEPQKISLGEEKETVVTAVNRLAKGRLVIEKQDASWSGKQLAGAVFEIMNTDTGTRFTAETGPDGRAVIMDLELGKPGKDGDLIPYEYLVREVHPPELYRLDFTERTVRFDGMEQEMGVLTYLLEVPNEETEILISKSDFDTGHFVVGARLAVYKTGLENGSFVPQGEAVDTWVSDGTPHRIIGRLIAGTFYILAEEQAPEGYIIAEPTLFAVSADGRKVHKISSGTNQIQISFRENSEEVQSISIVGRTVTGLEYTLEKNDTGRTLFERTRFSDGSLKLTGKETFRVSDKDEETEFTRREIVKTELVLSEVTDEGMSAGKEVERWEIVPGQELHQIVNKMDAVTELPVFAPGKKYMLEEICNYSDGSSLTTSKISFALGREGISGLIELFDKQTEAHFRKTDLTTGKELPGAELELRTEEGILVDQWITTEQEHVICGKLTPGRTYVLKETRSADGYAYAEEIRFTVNEEGCIEKVRMEDRPTDIVIRKTDLVTGGELPGAQLVLTDENGTVVDQWVSGDRPHEIKGKLTAGKTYILHEEAPPEGYAWAEDVIFTVSGDGKTDMVQMDDKPTRVVIHKTDITSGAELLGAWLAIKSLDGTVIEEWISEETPHEIVAVLAAGGRYLLCEQMAPDGYAYGEEVEFSVSLDGTIDRITMEDKPTVLEVEKQDEKDGTMLGGAVLQILDSAGKIVAEWVSEEGTAHRITGLLNAGESYILREITPPSGYEKAEDISFTMPFDGHTEKLVMEDRAVIPDDKPDREIPPEIVIRKYDKDTGEPLGGAEFTIWDDRGELYLTVTANRAGKAGFLRPEAGTYTYRETKAPDGYLGLDKTFTFTVTESGKIKGTLSVYDEREPSAGKTVGTITADYKADFGKKGIVYLDEDGIPRLRIPETGDSGSPVRDLCLMMFALGAFVWLVYKSGKNRNGRNDGKGRDGRKGGA